MLSLRREYLDLALKENETTITGSVLNVGGTRRIRGMYRGPQRASWINLNINASLEIDVVGTALALPFKDACYDTIISTEVLEYIPDPLLFFKEIHRVLKSNGKVIVSVPFLHPIHGDSEYDLVRYTETNLRKMVAENNFEICEFRRLGSLFAVVFDSMRVLTTYAGGKNRFLWLTLKFMRPVFRFLDSKFAHGIRHINTGYFFVLKKRG